jgi:glycosyltransferase involved in cell wall biosynthesis
MRILRIADVLGSRVGGMSHFMHATSEELRAMGHDVDLVFGEQIASNARGPWRRFTVPPRIVQLVRERVRAGVQYDVVDVHEPLAGAYALARRLDRSLPPLLVVSHGIEHRGHALGIAYMKKKGLERSLKSRVSPYSVIAQADLALKLADHVTVFNTEDAAFVTDRFGVARDHVSVLQTAVSDTFIRAPEPNPGARGVLFLGTWVVRKGTLDLVAAMTRVLDARPDLPFAIAGFGTSEEQVLAAFPERLRSRIRLVGPLDGEDSLLRIYREHAIYVLPSYFEGQPATMLEAAAAGLAIVATSVCGMKDFLEPGTTGLLVEPGDPESLARAIGDLADDRARAARLGARVRERARTFTWRNTTERFLNGAERASARGSA